MSAILSVIPVILLFVLMLGLKLAGHKSAVITLCVTIILALVAVPQLGMLPDAFKASGIFEVVGWSIVEGMLKAVFPILIIILMAIYSYNILVESRQIEVIKRQFTAITSDKGILVLMLVCGFGGLLEGMAGFGTAVAIPAAILIGLGFKPMFSALVALIGNTVATGFGAVGVPVTTLCNEVALGGAAPVEAICETSSFAVIQLAPLFILLLILVSGALCPPVNDFLKSHLVSKVAIPVIGSTFKFGWISNAGLMLFLGATIGGLIQGLSFGRMMRILARTTVNLKNTIITIICLISLASVMNYSGMISAMASGLVAVTGNFYPICAPLIGAVGTFVTGSDTSSNILFAKLQANVAGQLGLTGHSTFYGVSGTETNWLVAANTTGATGGKMISPQSIAIATAACDMQGKDGEILRSALPYAIGYIALGGLMVFLGL